MACYLHLDGEFSSVADAKKSCAYDSLCKGVYDNECDESSNDIYLCKVGDQYSSSSSSCIYDKRGISRFIFQISVCLELTKIIICVLNVVNYNFFFNY